jgi:phosphate uptake regulator
MNIRQHIQLLRFQLFEMSRLSQRAVDYSIKAFELRSKEFCRYVQNYKYEVGDLHRSVEDQCRQLLVAGLPIESDLQYALSAFRICRALYSTYSAAAEIAQNTMSSLEDGQIFESPALVEMGRIVNRSIRLCTVALFKEEVEHAKAVENNYAVVRWFELAVSRGQNNAHQQIGTQTAFELAIMKSFRQVAKQAHEMAGAITLCLERPDCTGFVPDLDLQEIAACRQ